MKYLAKISLLFFVLLVLFVSLRGVDGNPSRGDLNTQNWKEVGPFELSPERGRFALTFSLIEDKSFTFDLPVARFALPDLGYIDGKYVSLFAPGVSFLIIPGYIFGKLFGISQVGAFFVVAIFAGLNSLLIFQIAREIGAGRIYSIIASLVFIFATPAFTYAVSLYQHHISVFLLLLGVWIYLKYKGIVSAWVIWFLVALSIAVDYPNAFMMMPLVVLSTLQFFKLDETKEVFQIKFDLGRLISISGIIIPLLFFGWVNFKSYSDPFRLSGTVENVREIDENGLPKRDLSDDANLLEEYRSGERESNSVALGFFNSRNISNGLFVHFLSPDRGVIFYTPIIIFSVFGVYALYKKRSKALSLLVAISLINIFIYSMWGDPWGGWAFGSRYLIPLYACGSILLALGLDVIAKRKFLKAILFFALVYSVFVNSLGALTSNANPPKIEILALEEVSGREEKYTYERNWDYLKYQGTKSYFYNNFLKDLMNPMEFYILVTSSLIFLFTGLFSYDLLASKSPSLRVAKGKVTKDIKNVIIDEVIIDENGTSLPISNKLKIIENNIIFNWGKVISLWKNL